MKQKYDIHSLAVVPYLIAEMAVWTILETDYKSLTSEQCCKVVTLAHTELVARAERHYSNDALFRKGLHSKKNDQRYYLEMFMEHWAKGLLDRGKINHFLNS